MSPLQAAKPYQSRKLQPRELALKAGVLGSFRLVLYPVPAHFPHTDKYDKSAAAMIAQLKYGSGTPFHRLEQLEKHLGVPLPAVTQWEIVEQAGPSDQAVP